jgi:hypothetical protein
VGKADRFLLTVPSLVLLTLVLVLGLYLPPPIQSVLQEVAVVLRGGPG